MNLVFTLYGFGEVGSLTAALLNSNFTNCTFNLMNTQPSKSGRIIDLEHAAASQNNSILHNSKEAISQSDFLIYSAGFSNKHGESRNSVSSKNKQLVNELFSDLALKESAKVIVITNPVEPIAYWLFKALKKKICVVGTGTSLDSIRLKYLLSEKYKAPLNSIETMVIGEHGSHMVPLYSSTTLAEKKFLEISNESDRTSLNQKLIDAAFAIRETEPATKYGISQVCLQIVNAFLNKEKTLLTVSIPISKTLQMEFDCSKELFISVPCFISDMGIQPAPFTFSKEEKNEFANAVNSIEKIITI